METRLWGQPALKTFLHRSLGCITIDNNARLPESGSGVVEVMVHIDHPWSWPSSLACRRRCHLKRGGVSQQG